MRKALLGATLLVALIVPGTAIAGQRDNNGSENSKADIDVDFSDDCRTYTATSSKDISYIDEELAAGGRQPRLEGNFEHTDELGDNDKRTYKNTAPAGDRYESVTVKSGTTTETFECTPSGPERCDNEVDDDGDGQINEGCTEGPPGNENCSDGVDNDNDGLTDGADPDCKTERCDNEVDDDGDGVVNEGCTEGPPGNENCSDGVDNDNDGLTDGADPDCKTELCTNTIDDDGDGQINEGCQEICGDNIDNDQDGLTDEGCTASVEPYCRASALRIEGLLGQDPIEPFATERDDCDSPAEGLIDQTFGGGTNPGSLTVRVLPATETPATNGGSARAGVLEVIITGAAAPANPVLRASVLMSETSVNCSSGSAVIGGGFRILELEIFGNPIDLDAQVLAPIFNGDPDGNPNTITIPGLLVVGINQQPSANVRQALVVDVIQADLSGNVLDRIVVGETEAGCQPAT